MFDLAAAQQWVQQCATHVDHAVAMAIIKIKFENQFQFQRIILILPICILKVAYRSLSYKSNPFENQPLSIYT